MSERAVPPYGLLAAGIALLAAVEVLSLAAAGSVNRLAEVLPGADKAFHLLAFAALTATCVGIARWRSAGRRGLWWLVAALVGVAVVDEVAQAFQPARHVDLADLVASLSGIALAMVWPVRRRSTPLALTLMVVGLASGVGVAVTSYGRQRHVASGLRYSRVGDFSLARVEYRAAYAAGLRGPGLFNELAWVEVESEGNAAEAVAFAAQALVARPDDPDVQDTYGWALHYAGRSADALPYLERAMVGKPSMFCVHYHLGMVHLALGATDKAIEHLKQQVRRPETREAARAERVLARLVVGH